MIRCPQLTHLVLIAILLGGCRSGGVTGPPESPFGPAMPAHGVQAELPGEPLDRSDEGPVITTAWQEPPVHIDPATMNPPDPDLPPVAAGADVPPVPADGVATTATGPLQLADVLASVVDCYPLINAAIGEIEAARGNVIASWGEFDSTLEAFTISEPLGFYQTYRNGVGLTRPLTSGGEVFGGYRIGRGNFAPWYGERQTNAGGEFKLGMSLPLVKDRAVDERRAALWSARFRQQEVESSVASRLLQFQRFATQAYWEWRAAGRAVETQNQLLNLATQRTGQISQRVSVGDLPQIAKIDNDRFIAKRKAELIKAQRGFEKAAIKLSLFYRDPGCAPVIADASQLPDELPDSLPLSNDALQAGIEQAISIRPEIAELQALARQACVDLNYARNLTLPRVNLEGYGSKDVGTATSASGDKTPFELQLGLLGEVPLQRREGRGKARAAEAKLAQIRAKQQFAVEKITAEVQDAASAVNAACQRIEQARNNVELARRSLELGRLSFDAGDINLIELNIYETAVADAELDLIFAQLEYFFFQAVYETAIQGTAF